jgi:hypothetical protein
MTVRSGFMTALHKLFGFMRHAGDARFLGYAPQVPLMLGFLLSLCHETAYGGDAFVRGWVVPSAAAAW